MRERALQLAGMVFLESVPGQGTALRTVLPARFSQRDTGSASVAGLVPAGLPRTF